MGEARNKWGEVKTNIGGAMLPLATRLVSSDPIFRYLCPQNSATCSKPPSRDNLIIVKRLIWSSGNAFVSGANGLGFNSRAGQIECSVAKSSSPLRHLFERSCVAGAMTQRWASQTGYKLWRNTQSIMKDLI